MMTGEIVYAVVDESDHRMGGGENKFKLFETLRGAKAVLNNYRRYKGEEYRLIKVHLEEVDTIEVTKPS